MIKKSDFLESKRSGLVKNPFRVPEGYFDSLKTKIITNLPREKAEPIHRLPLMRRMPRLYPAIGIAASVVIAVGALSVYLISLTSGDSSAVDFCNLLDKNDMYMVLTSSM